MNWKTFSAWQEKLLRARIGSMRIALAPWPIAWPWSCETIAGPEIAGIFSTSQNRISDKARFPKSPPLLLVNPKRVPSKIFHLERVHTKLWPRNVLRLHNTVSGLLLFKKLRYMEKPRDHQLKQSTSPSPTFSLHERRVAPESICLVLWRFFVFCMLNAEILLFTKAPTTMRWRNWKKWGFISTVSVETNPRKTEPSNRRKKESKRTRNEDFPKRWRHETSR